MSRRGERRGQKDWQIHCTHARSSCNETYFVWQTGRARMYEFSAESSPESTLGAHVMENGKGTETSHHQSADCMVCSLLTPEMH